MTKLASALSAREHFHPIVELDLSYNPGITDECIPALLSAVTKNCPVLAKLNLNGTSITDNACRSVGLFYAENVVNDTCALKNIGQSSLTLCLYCKFEF